MIYEILLMLYVVGTLFGLWFVFKKAGVAPWKAVVPVYNMFVWVQVCGKPWSWYILLLIPGINIFMFLLLVDETAKVFHRDSFWEQTAAVLAPCIYLPIVGLSDWQYEKPRRLSKEEKAAAKKKTSQLREWAEAIVFALIAAVIIRGFVFELYSIPSSSMERSLRVGDHLLVSKLAYGPRVLMTPLALPLMHNTIVGTKIQSYLDWPQLPYYRFPGYTHVKRYDAVVFNFPAGDTVLTNFLDGKYTYYEALRDCGREAVLAGTAVHPAYGPVGDILVRPVDKRENYIKRCMGLPGETLQIINGVVHINGRAVENPADVQFYHKVTFAGNYISEEVLDECGMSREDVAGAFPPAVNPQGMPLDSNGNLCLAMSLSASVIDNLMSSGYARSIEPYFFPADSLGALYPNVTEIVNSVDNYGPVHIPAKGETLKLTLYNLPWYRRVITAYEGHSLTVNNGKIFIDGSPADSYTFEQDYYWMMGDNRHNSQDSRYWGFVPEDHIVGKARWVLFSRDNDHGKMRWDRIMLNANAH
jgi:signal peptidase I